MSSTTVSNGQFLEISGVITWGTINIQGTSETTGLEISGNATLNNGGTILLAGPDSNIYSAPTGGNTLDNVNGLIEGAGHISSILNGADGTIDANSASALGFELGIGGATPFTNHGLVEATSSYDATTNAGGLQIVGNGTLTNSGLIEAISGGGILIVQDATIDNSGGTVAAIGAGSVVTLENGGDIVGGTLETSGGGVIQGSSLIANTLDGSTTLITITAGSTIEAPNNSQLILNGTFNNAGTIFVDAINDATSLEAGGSLVTLSGGGVLVLNNSYAVLDSQSGSSTTINNVNNTIEGAGQIGTSANPLALENEAGGTIDSDNYEQQLSISNLALNSGLIEATNRTDLQINNTSGGFTNYGTISSGIITGGFPDTIEIMSEMYGNGTVEFGNNSTLTLDAMVTGQTVIFVGSSNTLNIGDIGGFHAVIAQLSSSNIVDFTGITVVSDEFNPTTHVLTLFGASGQTIGTLQFGTAECLSGNILSHWNHI